MVLIVDVANNQLPKRGVIQEAETLPVIHKLLPGQSKLRDPKPQPDNLHQPHNVHSPNLHDNSQLPSSATQVSRPQCMNRKQICS